MQYTSTTIPIAATVTTTRRPWLASPRLAALDAALAAKCSHADLLMFRRFIFSNQATEATAAMRYTETLRAIRRANRRRGRALARRLAKDRDADNQLHPATQQAPVEPTYEVIPF